jgi:membrane-bound lytic murein transglycosylase D
VNIRFLTPPWFLLFTLFTLATASHAEELFPRPPELQPDVDFWVKVYTEVDTKSGYIHDSEDVTIIYETLELSGDYHPDRKLIKKVKERYRKILTKLANSPHDQLSEEEQRVFNLWGRETGRERLMRAGGKVRFQRGQSDRFREGLVRSGEWSAYIEAVLSEKGLPLELGVLPHVESSFNPNAYSKVGAAGIWQFTRSTGRRYLHVDYVVDERMDPFAATRAAAQLLEHNYQLTGTWPLALTAYNHGAASMRRATRKLGTTDIAVIARKYNGRSFGFASRNFYVSFLAALEVSSRPEHYFGPIDWATPVQYAEVELTDYLLVDSFARAFEVDFKALKAHNRALLDPIWRGKKRIPAGYTIRVPRDQLDGSPEQLLAGIPVGERFSEQTPDMYHTVVRGDTVSEIAARYGHSIRDVAAMNGLNRRYQIRIGQVLKLPYEGPLAVADAGTAAVTPATVAPPAVAEADEPEILAAVVPATQVPAAGNGEPVPTVVASMGTDAAVNGAGLDLLADPSDYSVAGDNTIEVQASETLGHYAEWLDLRASQLRRLNGRRYGRPVVVGHRLKLDFSRVSHEEFERRRLAYQRDLQQAFFMSWHIHGTRSHTVAEGESLWLLTQRYSAIPMWLLRQYNPDLDPDKLRPGMVIVIPELARA